ncbi:copper resistance protein CopC [Paenibacillus tarimensis]
MKHLNGVINKYKFGSRLLLFLFFAGMILTEIFAGYAPRAEAHAAAERFVPQPGERMDTAPEKAEITFNEAIETGIGGLQVLDSQSKSVTDAAYVISQNRRTITLPLPRLAEGVYTVAYRIISEDGHPVSGSYTFIVGDPPEAKDASTFDLHKQLGHTGHGAATELTTGEFVLYVTRVLYYASLLFAAGLMLWFAMLRDKSEVQLAMFRKWGLWAVRALLISVLLYVFVHARAMMEGYPAAEWAKLFTSTQIGITWLLMVVMSLSGFIIIGGNRALRAVWAVLLLGLESYSGHAAAYDPKWYAILLDLIHLAGSAIWAGGLAFLVILWFEERKDAGRFASQFSNAAWLSIAVLTVTGLLTTYLFLPGYDYLFYTSWGTLLIVKTVLVLLVIIVGALLRIGVRRGNLPANWLLRMDVSLMALIIVVVGIFTYISPLPANEPVSAHQMGDKLHVTLRISPNVPGDNKFTVKVWLPEETGKPKSVRLLLRSEDRSDLGPIEVPIKAYEDPELDAFDGFVKAAYEAEGAYIPFPGQWTAEIRIMDPSDNEMVHREPFRNY